MGIVEETQTETHMNFRPMSGVIGSNVVNVKEEKLGKIDEVMLDVERGKIAYVVISFGGWLGTNNKLFQYFANFNLYINEAIRYLYIE